MKPLCFVAMPFGQKPDATGRTIDFERVYAEIIRPGVEAADMEPLRGDHEQSGGMIHKAMFERLVLCDFAVADLTTANANVFYELGIRHGIRPASTVLLFASEGRLPFDVGAIRAIPYQLDAAGVPVNAAVDAATIASRLRDCRRGATDSPVFQLLDGMSPPEIARLRSDAFRDRVEYSRQMKRELERARRSGLAAVGAFEERLGAIDGVEAGVIVDLFLSYRTVSAFQKMIDLAGRMPRVLAGTTLVQEQLAFALNRVGRGEEAEMILRDLIAERGPSSETYGLLGRVYKDRAERASVAGSAVQARGHLDRAIEAYRKGFECDWRDAFPGINAATLMEIRDPPDPERARILPVVVYSAERRLAASKADYFDHATVLEASVLNGDRERAGRAAADALALVTEEFQPQTTARNLRLIREAREKRGEDGAWIAAIESDLAAARPSG